jgi:nucleoside phosphorylase
MGTPLLIRATWANHMGREQAQAVASALIQAHPARCLAMSGICAGRRGKVSLGDVIFADRLWSYDVGKIEKEDGKDRFLGDIMQFRPDPAWVQRMQAVSIPSDAAWLAARPRLSLEQQEDWALLRFLVGDDPRRSSEFDSACPDWTAVLTRLWTRKWLERSFVLTVAGREKANELELLYPRGLPEQPEFKRHVAPLATGASVTEDDGIFPRLATSMRRVLGVEMEASALGALGEMHRVPVIVAKAVSDHGDSFKDDRYRDFAARAAAECLIGLLRGCADLLPERAPGSPANAPHGAPKTGLPLDLIQALAELYPDVRDARALWERAGGRRSEVEDVPRPVDLWQRLWGRSMNGASVLPEALLQAALADHPNNKILADHLARTGRGTEALND